MSKVTYEIVEHDGGWAYQAGDGSTEPCPRPAAARPAAPRAAAEQVLPGATETIEYEDEGGKWHREVDAGDDRPSTEVLDEE
jgi:hypothetical protein